VDPVQTVRTAVAAAIADLPTEQLGVACSGGPDSVALADAALAEAGERVTLLHVDHGLHPDSPEVAARVRGLADRLGAPCEVLRVTVAKGASLEDQARIARYAALEEAAARLELAAILAGHTARDQAETVLLRILRGTGPGGLAGIPPIRGVHRRPLLGIPRQVIEAYVAARALPTVDDPMNDDPRFARVRVRTRLLPALVAENPRVEDALLRLARAAAEWSADIDGRAVSAVGLAKRTKHNTRLPAKALEQLGPAAGKRALQLLAPALEADHLDAAWALVLAPARGSRGVDVPGARIERVYDDLVVRSADPRTSEPELLVDGPDGPYAIRRWRAGDRMRPARLRGRSRKLSDLFVDAKVPRAARSGARVVVDAAGAIVWAEHLGAAFGASITVRPALDDR
jgi:tRNA(Ile)-lysidine synthase